MPRQTGAYERTTAGGEEVAAFVPRPLPPTDPPLEIDEETQSILTRAEHAISRLELAGEQAPSIDWFVYAFVRKEAVISSQIEGIPCTLIDLLNLPADADTEVAANDDMREVCNYLDALTYARKQLASKCGLPISMRLLNESHRLLMQGVRGANKAPGEVRCSQNWIGGTRPGNASFVPPPPHRLAELLADFERYVHQGNELPVLIRAGLLHVQFETLHPYLDGNGRIGRLLVALLLEHHGVLTQPLLYLGLYFKRNRQKYYRRLGAVRSEGDWEGWTRFFLEGVATISDEAVELARETLALVAADRQRALYAQKSTLVAARLFEVLPSNPVLSIPHAMRLLDTTRPTATKAVNALIDAGVLVETTGRKKNQRFSYSAYLDLLRVGTELEGE